MNWQVVRDGLHRWEPCAGVVYECERVNYRSQRYFARINGRTINTGRNTVFRGSLEDCRLKCEQHHLMSQCGGEAP